MNKIKGITTIVVLLLMVLTSILSTGCAVDEWTLVEEGVLTDIQGIKGRYALTFDQTRVVLLKYGYGLNTPTVLVLNQYYYLYKENAGATWNGYHLVETRREYIESKRNKETQTKAQVGSAGIRQSNGS